MTHVQNVHALALAQCRNLLGPQADTAVLVVVGCRTRRDGRWTVTVRVHLAGVLVVDQCEPHIVVVVGAKMKAAAEAASMITNPGQNVPVVSGPNQPIPLVDFSSVMGLLSQAEHMLTLGYNQRAEELREQASNLSTYLASEVRV